MLSDVDDTFNPANSAGHAPSFPCFPIIHSAPRSYQLMSVMYLYPLATPMRSSAYPVEYGKSRCVICPAATRAKLSLIHDRPLSIAGLEMFPLQDAPSLAC